MATFIMEVAVDEIVEWKGELPEATPFSDVPIVMVEGKPYMLDTDLAPILGYKSVTQLRELAKRNMLELQRKSTVHRRNAQYVIGNGAIRHAIGFIFDERQVMKLVMLSETQQAADMRDRILDALEEAKSLVNGFAGIPYINREFTSFMRLRQAHAQVHPARSMRVREALVDFGASQGFEVSVGQDDPDGSDYVAQFTGGRSALWIPPRPVEGLPQFGADLAWLDAHAALYWLLRERKTYLETEAARGLLRVRFGVVAETSDMVALIRRLVRLDMAVWSEGRVQVRRPGVNPMFIGRAGREARLLLDILRAQPAEPGVLIGANVFSLAPCFATSADPIGALNLVRAIFDAHEAARIQFRDGDLLLFSDDESRRLADGEAHVAFPKLAGPGQLATPPKPKVCRFLRAMTEPSLRAREDVPLDLQGLHEVEVTQRMAELAALRRPEDLLWSRRDECLKGPELWDGRPRHGASSELADDAEDGEQDPSPTLQ